MRQGTIIVEFAGIVPIGFTSGSNQNSGHIPKLSPAFCPATNPWFVIVNVIVVAPPEAICGTFINIGEIVITGIGTWVS